MGLFSRRRTQPDPSAVDAVSVSALHAQAGWAYVSGAPAVDRSTSTPGSNQSPVSDDSVAAGIPAALRKSWQAALAGGNPMPFAEDVAEHPLVRGDWVAATAAGVRLFSVLVDADDIIVLRRGMTTAVSGEAEMVNIGDGPTEKLALPGILDWRDLIDTPAWFEQPAWASVAEFLERNAEKSGLVSAWWELDPHDPTIGSGPLWPRYAKGNVTSFLNDTEEQPDPTGPPGVGFADPGVTGRWLWLHRWTPSAGRPPATSFTGAVGLVADGEGVVRCFLWPDRDTVHRVAVRGQDEWPLTDRRRVTGLYTQLAGADDVPVDWEMTDA